MTINPSKIQELIDQDGSHKALKEMIQFYLKSTPDVLKKMVENFYLKELKSLQSEAEALIAFSETIGADDMIQIAREIIAANDKDPEVEEYLRERIKKLKPELETIKNELSQYL